MMDFGRYGGYGRGMWGGGYMFMGLLCLVFFVALILWIVRMVTWRRHGMGCGMHGMHGMYGMYDLSLIHISEPTRLGMISYAVFCLKKKKKKKLRTKAILHI